MTVYVYGKSEAEVMFPDDDGAVVRELDDNSETWFPWSDLHSSGSAADTTISSLSHMTVSENYPSTQEGTK